MTVREYIGARYVPLFMGEWDSTATYEPLSIVQYQGNSYTSRQYVPSGIEITNTAYWANTGNYNAQVEAYRAEVSRYRTETEGQIEECRTEIEGQIEEYRTETDAQIAAYRAEVEAIAVGTMNITQIDGSSAGGNYTPTLIKTTDFSALIDTGSIADSVLIDTELNRQGVDKLDVFIITHFHGDHCSNYEHIMRAWCDTNTKMYIQMEPSTHNGQYYNWNGNPGYAGYHSVVIALATELGISCEVPIHGQELTFGKMKLTFYNCFQGQELLNVQALYDNAWCNNGNYDYYNPDTGIENTPDSTLNNYSLIALFDFGNCRYLETGDIEGPAQIYNAPYMRRANVMRVPHHLANKNGYEPFYNAVAPEVFIASGNLDVAFDEDTLASFRASYHFRYLKYLSYNANTYVNYNADTRITIKDGNVVSCEGEILTIDSSINADYPASPGGNMYLPLYAAFPPNYYHAKPYQAHEITLADLVKLKTAMAGGPYMSFFSGTRTGSEALGSAKIVNEIVELFAKVGVTIANPGASNGTQVVIDFSKMGIELHTLSGVNNNTTVVLFDSFTDFNTQAGWTVKNIEFKNPVSIEGTFTHEDMNGIFEGLSITNEEKNAILRCNNLLVTLEDSVKISMHKETDNPAATNYYQGIHIGSNGDIYTCRLSGANGVFRSYKHVLNNGSWTTTNPVATKFEVIF